MLVVDDDPGCRELIGYVMEDAGIPVVITHSGIEALSIVEESQPGVVLLDVNLPDVCGYEVCRRLRARFRDRIQIFFLSGSRVESFDRVGGLLLGADDYLVKPFANDELTVKVSRHLGIMNSNVVRDSEGTQLTPRETDVLRLLTHGKNQSEIADELVISTKTVDAHIQHILPKLGARSRAEAVAKALRESLVT